MDSLCRDWCTPQIQKRKRRRTQVGLAVTAAVLGTAPPIEFLLQDHGDLFLSEAYKGERRRGDKLIMA
jgi:hypothetical protein